MTATARAGSGQSGQLLSSTLWVAGSQGHLQAAGPEVGQQRHQLAPYGMPVLQVAALPTISPHQPEDARYS